MNKIKIYCISIYEKIENEILCFIVKYRIKLNIYNKNIDEYIKSREITLEEDFKDNKFKNNFWNLSLACWGNYLSDQKLVIKKEGFKIDKERLQFYINKDEGNWDSWEGKGPYYFNTAYFMTKSEENKGFYQKYGRFEIKIKLGKVVGTWPAFWLLSKRKVENNDDLTPILPEIDIFESHVKNKSTKKSGLVFTLHYGTNYDTPDKKMEANGIDGIDFSNEYWLVAVEWKQDRIEWYLNNHLVKVSRFSKIPKIHRPNYPCYIIFNDAIMTNYIDELRKYDKIESLSVDWIRVYK